MITRDGERLFVNGPRVTLGQDLLQVVRDSFAVLELLLARLFARGRFIDEGDLETTMQVAGDLDALADHGRLELRLWKDGRVGPEEHSGAGASRGTQFLDRAL